MKPTAGVHTNAIKLFVASNRNLFARLITAGVAIAAALPIMAWWLPALWACSVAALLAAETLVVRRSKVAVSKAAEARSARQLQLMTTLSGVNYSVLAALFWTSGQLVGQMFAVTLVMVVMLYFLLLYYARLNVLLSAIGPLLVTIAAGAAGLIWSCFQRGQPWAALTALMAVAIGGHYFVSARRSLAYSWTALRNARAQAVERGVAAESASNSKSQFLATMSHEIRTPLNGVLGMSQAMAVDALDPIQRERLVVIQKSGEALLAVLNDILDFSKIEAGKLELEEIEFDLGDLARSCRPLFQAAAEEKGVSLDIEVSPTAEGLYLGDPSRIRQILSNQLSNALKFTTKGGIRVSIDREGEGAAVRIAVSDTGEGVPPDQLAKLFERFVQADASTTRRHGGSGLGLAICRELAALMGGRMEAASVVGEGSTFTLIAPLERVGDAGAKDAAAQPGARPDSIDLRVLVAEDNAMNRLVLKTLLQQIGVEPAFTVNGQDTVDAWRGGEWDVVLMDVQMPVMDGPTATRAIRAEEAETGRPRTPIVALTANAMEHQVSEYRAAGMDDHVAKPIDAARLYAVLSQVLSEQEAEAQSKVA